MAQVAYAIIAVVEFAIAAYQAYQRLEEWQQFLINITVSAGLSYLLTPRPNIGTNDIDNLNNFAVDVQPAQWVLGRARTGSTYGVDFNGPWALQWRE